MQIDVYPSDAEAFDAAAALVAERLRAAAAGGAASIAVGGGRAGRAMLVALAGRSDLPWRAVDWFLADERCTDRADPIAHAKIAQDTLFGPRGVPATRMHVPAIDGAAPADVAARYADVLADRLGPAGAVDVVVLAVGPDGSLGALAPGSPALDATAWVAVVPADGAAPSRVAITPAFLARARFAVVTAAGPEVAAAVAAALRTGQGAAGRLLPSDRVTWVVDRAAAGDLLRDATPVAEGGA